MIMSNAINNRKWSKTCIYVYRCFKSHLNEIDSFHKSKCLKIHRISYSIMIRKIISLVIISTKPFYYFSAIKKWINSSMLSYTWKNTLFCVAWRFSISTCQKWLPRQGGRTS